MSRIDQSPPSAAVDEWNRQWINLQRWWAIAVFSLLFATWRLWFPTTNFPQVPMIDLPPLLGIVDSVVVAAIVASLGVLTFGKRHQQICHGILIASFLLAFVFNQHRLQPWAYQAVLYSVAFASLKPQSARTWLAAITISIYVYSACGKFDYQFLHTVGQEFVTILLGPIAAVDQSISVARLILAACLPIAELAIGLGLGLPKTRRAAGIAAMLMHASLVAILGPWNLNHSLGVLTWNAWLLVQAWFLFVSPALGKNPTEHADALQNHRITGVIGPLVLILTMLLPVLERTGYWDHWLSWSLYAPHTSRVEIEVHDVAIVALPLSVVPFVVEDSDGWHRIAIDRWSLEIVGVPLYPQARFQLGVAQAIANEIASQGDKNADGIRITIKSVSDRWTGTRKEQWLQGKAEIDRAAQKYWLLGLLR